MDTEPGDERLRRVIEIFFHVSGQMLLAFAGEFYKDGQSGGEVLFFAHFTAGVRQPVRSCFRIKRRSLVQHEQKVKDQAFHSGYFHLEIFGFFAEFTDLFDFFSEQFTFIIGRIRDNARMFIRIELNGIVEKEQCFSENLAAEDDVANTQFHRVGRIADSVDIVRTDETDRTRIKHS